MQDADAGEGGESSLSGGVNGDLGLMVLIPGEDDCADEEVEGGIDGVEGRLMELLGGGEEEDTKDSGGKEGNKREEAGADGGEAMASHTEEEGGNSGPLNWGKGTESLDDSMPLRGSPRGSTLPADAGATAFDLEDGGWEEDRRREDEAGVS